MSTSSPATALEGAELKTVSAQVVISSQLQERAAVQGGGFDFILTKQLHEQHEERVEKLTLGAVYATATSVAGASEYKTEKWYEDLSKSHAELADTTGTRLRATAVFTTTDFYGFLTRQTDKTTERPIVVPAFAPGYPLVRHADDFDSGADPQYARFTGTVWPGGALHYTSDAIEAIGTTSRTRIIISAPEVANVFGESEPASAVWQETKANVLQCVCQLRSYCFAITRHAGGNVILSSAAYFTTQK